MQIMKLPIMQFLQELRRMLPPL